MDSGTNFFSPEWGRDSKNIQSPCLYLIPASSVAAGIYRGMRLNWYIYFLCSEIMSLFILSAYGMAIIGLLYNFNGRRKWSLAPIHQSAWKNSDEDSVNECLVQSYTSRSEICFFIVEKQWASSFISQGKNIFLWSV